VAYLDQAKRVCEYNAVVRDSRCRIWRVEPNDFCWNKNRSNKPASEEMVAFSKSIGTYLIRRRTTRRRIVYQSIPLGAIGCRCPTRTALAIGGNDWSSIGISLGKFADHLETTHLGQFLGLFGRNGTYCFDSQLTSRWIGAIGSGRPKIGIGCQNMWDDNLLHPW
jgi:hypothetical protein